MCVCVRSYQIVTVHMHVFIRADVRARAPFFFGASERFLAAANLPPGKARLRLFTPLFTVCLKLNGSEIGSFIGSGRLKNGETIERGGALKQLTGAEIYFHLHKITGPFDRQANSCRHANVSLSVKRGFSSSVG